MNYCSELRCSVDNMRFDRDKHDEFTRLFVAKQSGVYRYIVSLVPNRADADELFQETNMTILKSWSCYDPNRDFFPWACKIALNHVRNFWRKRHEYPAVFDEDLLMQLNRTRLDEEELLAERQEMLTDCLEALPQAQKQLVRDYYAQDSSIKTFAEGRGRNTGSVYKMLERARLALHDCINRRLLSNE